MDRKIGVRGVGMKGILAILVLLSVSFFSIYLSLAVPQGATVNYIRTELGPNRSADSRTDPGGRIITINLDMSQQNYAWKAYVGNVSGKYVLENSNNRSIYEWPLSLVAGEMYISRNGTLTFGSVGCAVAGVVAAEDAHFGLSGTDSINGTFNSTVHSAMTVGTTPVSGCPSTALWVNDTVQTQGSSAIFQEILLNDSSQNLIYATILNNDRSGYDNVSSFDFQAIVADNRSSPSGATYYFYLELGS